MGLLFVVAAAPITAAPNRKLGLEKVETPPEVAADCRKSHKQACEAVAAANQGDDDALSDCCQARLVICFDEAEESKSNDKPSCCPTPRRPINGLKLCPLASQTRTEEPRAAAKCSCDVPRAEEGQLG